MHEEEAILSLGVVFLSLYQCAPPTTPSSSTLPPPASKSSECVGAVSDHRGNVLVPFYRGHMTYQELAGGVEYRLNQYFIVHSVSPSQTQCPMRVVSDDVKPPGCGRCTCSYSFNGVYFCSHCAAAAAAAGGDESVGSMKEQQGQVTMEEFPRIVVRNFTRAQDTELGKNNVAYEFVDNNWKVTEAKLCCFFYTVMERSTEDMLPILTKDGVVARPLIQRDHMRAYASDNAYHNDGYVKHYIELKVGGRLLRVGTSAGQRFEDIFQRLKRRNVHVHRLFDGVTGASILPCELVRHLSWKVSALCASVVTPLSHGFDVKHECNSDESMDDNDANNAIELGTLITLSEMPPDVHTDSTVRMALGSEVGGFDDGDGVWEEQRTCHCSKQQQQMVLGLGGTDDEDTVPIVNVFSPECQADPEENSTPLRSYYLDDDSYIFPLHEDLFSALENTDIAVTPTRRDGEEQSNIVADESYGRSMRRQPHFSQCDRNDSSSIMVTQQILPDFLPCSSDEEDDG